MTAITFTRLPLQAGSAVATSLGRFGLWTLSQYMRAPLASTGLIAMVTLTALAGSNALYFQTARHPAPLFAPTPGVPEPVDIAQPQASPLMAPIPAPQQSATSAETTGSVAPVVRAVPNEPVGNAQVFEVQKKLHDMGLFEGTVDGYYGPMTARAIRAFEQRNGREPTGALNRDVIDAILRADSAGIAPVQQQQQVAVATPQPAAAQPRVVQAAAAQQPVMPPAPVQDRVVARLPALSPAEQAFDAVTESAATTIDSIVAAVDGGRQTPAAPAVKPVPALSLMASEQPMPAPVRQVAAIEAAAPMQQPTTMSDEQPVNQTMSQTVVSPANNPELVSQIQRGLASLGFLVGPIDGKPGEATAKAIRSFEVFHNYQMTGQITPELPKLLRDAGASI